MMHISIGIPESSVSSALVSAVFAAVSASIWRRLEISVLDALTAPSLHIEAIVRRSVSTPSLVFALIVTIGSPPACSCREDRSYAAAKSDLLTTIIRFFCAVSARISTSSSVIGTALSKSAKTRSALSIYCRVRSTPFFLLCRLFRAGPPYQTNAAQRRQY